MPRPKLNLELKKMIAVYESDNYLIQKVKTHGRLQSAADVIQKLIQNNRNIYKLINLLNTNQNKKENKK